MEHMENIKKHLVGEITSKISAHERDAQESDHDLGILGAKLKVERKVMGMQDLPEHLKEDFSYSVQALEDMVAQEHQRNAELKKDLVMLRYRKAALENKFLDDELNE